MEDRNYIMAAPEDIDNEREDKTMEDNQKMDAAKLAELLKAIVDKLNKLEERIDTLESTEDSGERESGTQRSESKDMSEDAAVEFLLSDARNGGLSGRENAAVDQLLGRN